MTSRATPPDALYRRQMELVKRRQGPNARPVAAMVTSVDPRNEQVTFRSSGLQNQRCVISHPYMGVRSWLRVMPEAGTHAISAERGDAPLHNILAYVREGVSSQRLEATERGEDVYRELQEGSIELMSSGRAVVCGTERGTLELRGGPLHAHLNPDLQEWRVRAPTHRVECLGFAYARNINNMRFGVVKRLPQGATASPIRVERPIKVDHGGLQVYAKEHSVVLHSKGTPSLLADVRMGHVVADDGTEPTLGETSEKLRYLALLGTKTATDTFRVEVDVTGNMRVQAPRTANEGITFDALDGKVKVQANREMILITRDKFTVTSQGLLTIQSEAADVLVKGQTIKFGPSATSGIAVGPRVVASLNALITALSSGPLVVGSAPSPTLVAALLGVRATLSSINSTLVYTTR